MGLTLAFHSYGGAVALCMSVSSLVGEHKNHSSSTSISLLLLVVVVVFKVLVLVLLVLLNFQPVVLAAVLAAHSRVSLGPPFRRAREQAMLKPLTCLALVFRCLFSVLCGVMVHVCVDAQGKRAVSPVAAGPPLRDFSPRTPVGAPQWELQVFTREVPRMTPEACLRYVPLELFVCLSNTPTVVSAVIRPQAWWSAETYDMMQ